MKHVETALNPSNIRFPESFRKTDSELKLYVKAFCWYIKLHGVALHGALTALNIH